MWLDQRSASLLDAFFAIQEMQDMTGYELPPLGNFPVIQQSE